MGGAIAGIIGPIVAPIAGKLLGAITGGSDGGIGGLGDILKSGFDALTNPLGMLSKLLGGGQAQAAQSPSSPQYYGPPQTGTQSNSSLATEFSGTFREMQSGIDGLKNQIKNEKDPSKRQELMMQLQELMDQMKQLFEMLTNIQKTQAGIANSIIGNIRN
jgi:hypothetical protein